MTLHPKQSAKRITRTGITGIAAALPVLFVAFSTLPLAAQGGKKPGGGGGTVTELPVPPLVAAPIAYQITDFLWENAAEASDPDFGGIYINGVNSRGLVTGHVKPPPPEPGTLGKRLGTVNVGTNGEATDTMVDLNVLFSGALAELNARRASRIPAEEPWRIAYGRRINEAGQIACQLLPQSAARSYGTGEGGTLVPSLHVVGNLVTRTLIEVDPNNTSPDQDVMEMNENGDLLMRDYNGTAWVSKLFVYHAGSGTYVNQTSALPASVNPPSFNTSLQVCYTTEILGTRRSATDRLFLRTPGVSPDALLWENAGKDYDNFYWELLGVAESGTVYAARSSINSSTGLRTTIPYHVLSPTQRRPLTTGNANGFHAADRPSPELSRAPIAGEEEIAFNVEGASGLELQMYKPKFGARFALPGAFAGILYNLTISPPHNRSGNTPAFTGGTYTGTYYGGYVAVSWCIENTVYSYLLTPAGATLPSVP